MVYDKHHIARRDSCVPIVKLLSNEQQELHQVTLLPGVLLNLLAIFQDASLIAKLLKTFLEFLKNFMFIANRKIKVLLPKNLATEHA